MDDLLRSLTDYRRRFGALAQSYDGSTRRAAELEQLMGEYSAFVTDQRNEESLTALERDGAAGLAHLVAGLRAQSARCAAVMEKYRALDLLEGRARSRAVLRLLGDPHPAGLRRRRGAVGRSADAEGGPLLHEDHPGCGAAPGIAVPDDRPSPRRLRADAGRSGAGEPLSDAFGVQDFADDLSMIRAEMAGAR